MADTSAPVINWRLYRESYLDTVDFSAERPPLALAFSTGAGRWIAYACLAELGFRTRQFPAHAAQDLFSRYQSMADDSWLFNVFASVGGEPRLLSALRDRFSRSDWNPTFRHDSYDIWDAALQLWECAQEDRVRRAVTLLNEVRGAGTDASLVRQVHRIRDGLLGKDDVLSALSDLTDVSEFVAVHARIREFQVSLGNRVTRRYVQDFFDKTVFCGERSQLHRMAVQVWSTLNGVTESLADTGDQSQGFAAPADTWDELRYYRTDGA